MKLIIDIPDNQYNQICELRLHNRTIFDDAIRKGIPLNEVLDKIRDEIRKQNIADFIAVQSVLEIIDQYRKGESNEID